MAIRIVTDQAPVQTPMVSRRSGIAGTLASALLSNRKALAGAAVLVAFTLIAIFAPVISPYDPHALQFEPILGPSRAHLLGTPATARTSSRS